MAFGKIPVHMIEFPFIFIEIGSLFVKGHGFPPVAPNSPMTEHLKILNIFVSSDTGISRWKSIGQACALNGNLGDAVEFLRRFQAEDFEDGGGNVADMMKLGPDPSLIINYFGPMNNEGIANASPMGIPFVTF